MAKNSKRKADIKDQLRLRQQDYPGMSIERAEAETAQNAIVANAYTARMYSIGSFSKSDITEFVASLRDKVDRVKAGNLEDVESMLVAQATALDAIFTELCRRGALNMATYMDATDKYLRLAFKAQSQCRTTLETLAEIKNPRPVAFVKQANIANGPQQVNNGTPAPSRGNSENSTNELSGATHDLLSDQSAKGTTSRINSQLEAVGMLDRTKNAGGKAAERPQ